jgi:hypothetical protein
MGSSVRVNQAGISERRDQIGQSEPGHMDGRWGSGHWHRAARALGILSAAVLTIAAKPAPNYGPPPYQLDAIKLAEDHFRTRLIDPESARFEWPFMFVSGTFKPMFKKRQSGFWTCGRVNSRNPMGGYSGAVPVFVLINSGKVVMAELGDPMGDPTPASVICDDAKKKGELPVAK